MRRSTIIGALLAGGLALAGCSPSEEPSDQPPAPGTPPPATEQASGEATGAVQGSAHTGTDKEFAQQLLTHHEQLVELAGLAERNAQDPRIKELAAEIQQSESAEIGELEAWLAATAGEESDSAPEDAEGSGAELPSALSPEELDQLREIRGSEFDRRWQQAVLALEEGALQVAKTELDEGSDEEMRALAEKIVSEQPAQIDKVKSLG
ncbi:DUF305 domain-containing protein [Parasphingorhabdus pacifica]